jgi:triosephosphate isomerase
MLIAGNWKMNTDLAQAVRLAREVAESVGTPRNTSVAVCPPFISLAAVAEAVEGTVVRVGAQNMHFEESGAFTGEVSAEMLQSVGCHYVILGHSERRQYFGETDASVNKKAKRAAEVGLVPIVCVGETLEERDAGQETAVVKAQVAGGLGGLDLAGADRLVIAYEPVWAIGTGRTASPEQAQEMHAFIRGLLTARYGEQLGRGLHILYGGSMKPGNAAELLAKPDVDGGLIGGASLKAADFAAIVAAAAEAA